MAETQDLLIQEINDELKAERLLRWWQRFGSAVIGLCVALVVATAGYVYWKSQRLEANQIVTAAMLSTNEVIDRKQYDAAAKQLLTLPENATEVALLARLKAAAVMDQAGNSAQAEAEYAKVAAQVKAPVLAAYAKLRLEDYSTPAEAPFAGLKSELQAIALFEQGKKKEAQVLLQALLDDPATPRSAHNRAEELLAAFR